MPASFVLFSSLAAELRNQIWRDALPHHIGPTLYSYRKRGCWCPRRLTESEPGYIAGNDDLNLAFEFRTELLDDDNQYHVPLFSVNREARSIVIAWLQEHVSLITDVVFVSLANKISLEHQNPAPGERGTSICTPFQCRI